MLFFQKAILRLSILVWGVFLFFSTQIYGENNFSKLARKKSWLNLLHYQQDFWGDTASRADSRSFFMASDGQYNPRNELKETYKKFTSKDRFKWICHFPARYQFFLKNNLLTQDFSWEKKCPKLSFFRDQLSAKSISMVFSSYHVNTPASAFGHTLLRFNKSSAEGGGSELLDRAINYSANVTTSNALIYAILGITGGFYGEFAMLPYFYKMREYNDHEARDLWSYELNLTSSEISLLIDHLWELRQTLIRYYYFSENCSFYMLAVLDAVNPNWKLIEKSARVILPADTVRTLYKVPHFVKGVTYRPSLRKKLYTRYKGLTKKEKQAFYDHKKMNTLSKSSQVRVLDTVIENQDLRHSYKVLTNDEKASEVKRKLLIKRSQLEGETESVNIKTPWEEAPHNSHGSRRLRTLYSYHQNLNSIYSLEFRHALHDKSDPPWGYSSKMEIGFGKLRLGFTGFDYKGDYRRRILLEELELVKVSSHNPWTSFFKDFSWEFRVGIDSLEKLGSLLKLSPNLALSGGYYFEWGKFATGIYGKVKAQASSLFDKAYTVRLGPEWQVYYLTRKWSLGIKASMSFFLPQEIKDFSYEAEAYWSFFLGKNISVFTKWDWAKADAFLSERNRYWAGFSFYY